MQYWIDAVSREWGMAEAAAYLPEQSHAYSACSEGLSRTEALLEELDLAGSILLGREDFLNVYQALQDLSIEVSYSPIDSGARGRECEAPIGFEQPTFGATLSELQMAA